MKKEVLIVAAMLLCLAGLVQAQTQLSPPSNELHGSVDVTYLSKYIWRGFNIYGSKSAIQPSIDLNLYNTGFGVNAMGHRANSSGFETGERWDYSLYYQNSLFNNEAYVTNYRISYVYYNYPELSSHTRASADLQEINGMFSWPKILGVDGLVPSYVLVKLWPSNSESTASEASGFAHIFMLDYALHTVCPITGGNRVINLHSEVIYNDGVDPRGGGTGVDHDWSNAVFGASTDFSLAKNLVFTPGIYYQITMDKSVNTNKNETWAMANLSYKF